MRRRDLLSGAAAAMVALMLGRTGFAAGPVSDAAAVSTVDGTALVGARNPASPPVPMTDVTLVLLPRSDGLLTALERIRLHARDSLTAYRTAVPEMRRLVESAVADLESAGSADSLRSAAVDAEGRFSLGHVPAGPWILLGRRAIHIDRTSHDQAKESGTFLPQPRLLGYDRVLIWLQPIVVDGGRSQSVDLTDRNVWFEGVEEKTTARDRVPNTGSRRRSAR